jgi:hypothetical protein
MISLTTRCYNFLTPKDVAVGSRVTMCFTQSITQYRRHWHKNCSQTLWASDSIEGFNLTALVRRHQTSWFYVCSPCWMTNYFSRFCTSDNIVQGLSSILNLIYSKVVIISLNWQHNSKWYVGYLSQSYSNQITDTSNLTVDFSDGKVGLQLKKNEAFYRSVWLY